MTTALEQLPMTPGYFRQILRSFGDTPPRRAALLAGTGVSEAMVLDPAADISLFQQVRQIDNLNQLAGEDWVLQAPGIWQPASHGPLGAAALAAADLGTMIETVARYGYVRAPFFTASFRRGPETATLEYDLSAPIDERLWRPMVEISFLSIKVLMESVLGRSAAEADYAFTCPPPAHAAAMEAAFAGETRYGEDRNLVRFPAAWLGMTSPFADPALHAAGVAELRNAEQRVTAPAGLRGRVERLLSALPEGRMGAEEAARRLGVSRRTLVRRLAESGTGFRSLVDAEMRARAERLLGGDLRHAVIADMLGYTDPASFSRARRRWSRARA